MTIALNLINAPMKVILRTIMDIDDSEVKKIPMQGPLILATNHINSMDAPVGFTHLHPRELSAFVKVETWDNPILGFLFNVWQGIPIHRGEVDFEAFSQAQRLLKEKKMLIVAPEGTRSKDGKLNKGFPGIVLLAIRSGVPILPVVFYGNENFNSNIKSLRRTKMKIKVGEQFKIDFSDAKPTKEYREEVTEEIMYQIAKLLPAENRGIYSDMNQMSTKHLVFLKDRLS